MHVFDIFAYVCICVSTHYIYIYTSVLMPSIPLIFILILASTCQFLLIKHL